MVRKASEGSHGLSILSGILFLAAVGVNIFSAVINGLRFDSIAYMTFAILILLAIFHFAGIKQPGFAIPYLGYVGLEIYYISMTDGAIEYILLAVAFALMAVAFLVKPFIGRLIGAVGSLLFISIYVYEGINYDYFSYLEYTWQIFAVNGLLFLAMFMAAMWIGTFKDEAEKPAAAPAPTPVTVNINEAKSEPVFKAEEPAAKVEDPVLSIDPEKLEMVKSYKELVDAGIMTMDEFLEKRKELIGR